MSTKEVKKSIHFQILSVFFLPIIVAIIHFYYIFKIITTLLSSFRLINMKLFITSSIVTIILFLVFYTIVYWITSKVYYKIVK